MQFTNGMRASEIPVERWVKSAASAGIGECVEVALVPGGGVAVRNSRFPDGAALLFTKAEMTAFVAGAGAGEFDELVARSA
ncbi:DUF397 domain-containing protein [Streptomyces sp. NPDC058001]|uniref:DUF397 domain-containing protein n=1 Tax=Streptomyces sp. NPDC058001 TaxID=3346300 RepID=UPI0036E9696C